MTSIYFLYVAILIMVGALLFQNVSRIEWHSLKSSAPAFVVLFFIPFTFSLIKGVWLGYFVYILINIATGEIFVNLMLLIEIYFPVMYEKVVKQLIMNTYNNYYEYIIHNKDINDNNNEDDTNNININNDEEYNMLFRPSETSAARRMSEVSTPGKIIVQRKSHSYFTPRTPYLTATSPTSHTPVVFHGDQLSGDLSVLDTSVHDSDTNTRNSQHASDTRARSNTISGRMSRLLLDGLSTAYLKATASSSTRHRSRTMMGSHEDVNITDADAVEDSTYMMGFHGEDTYAPSPRANRTMANISRHTSVRQNIT